MHTPNEITSGLRASRSSCSLDRLRKRTVVLKDAPNKCAAKVCPTHPPYGGACESINSLGHRTFTKLPYTRFVKEQRRKISRETRKNFRALDNDDKLKSKHARSGLPLRALVVI